MKNLKIIAGLALACLMAGCLASCSGEISKGGQEPQKPRLIVTTDPELDDNNSLIRFILHTDEFKVEGLVYSSSCWHWKGDGKGTIFHGGIHQGPMGGDGLQQMRWPPEGDTLFIDRVLNAYTKVYPNLKVHDPEFPAPDSLKAVVRWGNVNFEGDYAEDTPGSDLIKERILAPSDQPLYVQVWGGPSTVARALKSIEDEYSGTPQWEEVKAKVNKTLVILLSGYQDNTYENYISKVWPDVKAYFTADYDNTPAKNRVGGTGLGMAYNSQFSMPDEARAYYMADWMDEHVTGVGPLGAEEYVWGDGKFMAGKGKSSEIYGFSDPDDPVLLEVTGGRGGFLLPKGTYISEGDNGCFMNFYGNGLRAWEDWTWGGFTGRLEPDPTQADIQAAKERMAALMKRLADANRPGPARAQEKQPTYEERWARLLAQPKAQIDTVLPDFRIEVQEDLAARLQWSVNSDYSAANHAPVISGPLAIEAKPGQKLKLAVTVSDPDGNQTSKEWKIWGVGTYKGQVQFTPVISEGKCTAELTVPSDAVPGQTIHAVMRVRDNAQNPMTSYLRTVITVK